MKIFEQFAESSTNIGLDEDLTAKILLEIFETTSNLIKEKSLSNIKELRRTITSKGGCTETLITTLEKNNLKSLIDNATLNSFEKIMSFSKK